MFMYVQFVSYSPYVIGTMNQGVSSSPNLELHHNFRYCAKTFCMSPKHKQQTAFYGCCYAFSSQGGCQ